MLQAQAIILSGGGMRGIHMPVLRVERQQTVPRHRYRVCSYCRHPVRIYWHHDYCERCYRTFATGKYDQAR